MALAFGVVALSLLSIAGAIGKTMQKLTAGKSQAAGT